MYDYHQRKNKLSKWHENEIVFENHSDLLK